MKQEKWADALDRLNPDYITEAMPHRSAKRLKRGKERIMKQEFSIIKLTTGIVATAAVVALVAGSAVLISSMNQRVETQPGHSGSTAEGTTTAVTTTTTAPEEAAITTTLSTAAQPELGTNFLGGTGDLRAISMSGTVGTAVLYDDQYWYAEGRFGNLEGENADDTMLSDTAMNYFSRLMTDGKQLYTVNANSLFTVDANGTESPFYTYEGYSHVVYAEILNLGNSMSPEFATDDPWYYIGGWAGNEGGAEGSYIADKFGVFYQPATGKQMNVEKLFDKTGETFYAPNEVRACGNSVYALVGDGCTVASIPHPDALMSDRVQLDWVQQYYELPVHGDGYVADWSVRLDTINYAFYDSNVCYAGRFWMQDGATEENQIGGAEGNVIQIAAKYAGDTLRTVVNEKVGEQEGVSINSEKFGKYSSGGMDSGEWMPFGTAPANETANINILAADSDSIVWAVRDENGDISRINYVFQKDGKEIVRAIFLNEE